jgi:hypothetical protein
LLATLALAVLALLVAFLALLRTALLATLALVLALLVALLTLPRAALLALRRIALLALAFLVAVLLSHDGLLKFEPAMLPTTLHGKLDTRRSLCWRRFTDGRTANRFGNNYIFKRFEEAWPP